MKWAATHFAPDFFQAQRLNEMLAQQRYDPLNALASEALLAITEQFVLTLSFKEEIGHDFQHLAVIPEWARALHDRWVQQVREPLLLPCCQPVGFAQTIVGRLALHECFHERMECSVGLGQLFAKKLLRELNRDETMPLV